MRHVEGQDMADAVDVANGDQTRIVNLFANDTGGLDKLLPSRIDVRRIGQKRERSLIARRQNLNLRDRKSEAICGNGASGAVTKLNEVLWSGTQAFALVIQNNHRLLRDGVLTVAGIGKAHQKWRIHEVGHQSWSS